jgi:hypothetical protein
MIEMMVYIILIEYELLQKLAHNSDFVLVYILSLSEYDNYVDIMGVLFQILENSAKFNNMAKAIFNNSAIDKILEFSHPELKVLHALTTVAKHNYLALDDTCLAKLDQLLGQQSGYTQKRLPDLVRKQVLVKIDARTYIIDPAIVLVGNYDKAMKYIEDSKNTGEVKRTKRKNDNASRKDWEEKKLKKKLEEARNNEDPAIYDEAEKAFGD